MPGFDAKGALRPDRVDTPALLAGPVRNRLYLVETVGRRKIVGCDCGNYFFADKALAVCDQCGAEAALEDLPRAR